MFNSMDPTIKFEENISIDSLDFLDVTVYKGRNFHLNGYLDTKVFLKETDTHQLLHMASYHPNHTFKSIIIIFPVEKVL